MRAGPSVAGPCMAGPSRARGAGGGRAGRPACCARGGGWRARRVPAAGGPAAPAAGGRRAHLHVWAGRRAVPAGAPRAPPRGVRGSAWVSVTLGTPGHACAACAPPEEPLRSRGKKRCAPGVLSGLGRSGALPLEGACGVLSSCWRVVVTVRGSRDGRCWRRWGCPTRWRSRGRCMCAPLAPPAALLACPWLVHIACITPVVCLHGTVGCYHCSNILDRGPPCTSRWRIHAERSNAAGDARRSATR